MAGIQRLMETKNLRTTLLQKLDEGTGGLAFFNYDEDIDILLFLIVPPTTETIAHYVDEHVALLYQPEDREVVGLQVEDFRETFLPKYADVRRAWRLSDATKEFEDLGDLVIAVRRQEPMVAREVVKVTEDLLFGGGMRPDLAYA